MNLDKEEKIILKTALNIYSQIAKQQGAPPAALVKVKALNDKLSAPDEPEGEQGPEGITDEQFEQVCKCPCANYKNGKCTDVVAKKYPGKCDPILHFNNKKLKESTDE